MGSISASANLPIPVNESEAAAVASAATIDLNAVTGNLIHITGTTGISAMTLAEGAERTLVFDDALTLTHNAAILDLPGKRNITTAAGDRAIVRGEGGGLTRMIVYVKASGTDQPLLASGEITVASAAIDFLTAFGADYDCYRVVVENISPSALDSLRYRAAVAGAVDSGAGNYDYVSQSSTTSASAWSPQVSASASNILLTSVAHDPATVCSLELLICNVNSTGRKEVFSRCYHRQDTTNAGAFEIGAGAYRAANTQSGFRLYWGAASNFDSATARVYGVPNT